MTSLNITSGRPFIPPDDFRIVCFPRSGSHMLATALDSHPFITCHGENNEAWLGLEWFEDNIVGRIDMFSDRVTDNLDRANKWIILTRGEEERKKSLSIFSRSSHIHLLRESSVRIKGGNNRLPIWTDEEESNRQAALLAMEDVTDSLVISYEELTEQGTDTAQFTKETSNTLCDFLGVKRAVLLPATAKLFHPKRSTPR